MDRFSSADLSNPSCAAKILKSQLESLRHLARKRRNKSGREFGVARTSSEKRSSRSLDDTKRADPFCVFCKKNGAPKDAYRSHTVKDNRGNVVCPILRKFNCVHCNNGGGDQAHTANFCPKMRGAYLNSFMKNKDEA
ncbi:nanos homolog 1 [Galendromus occidentalis]|uniref:Nanos homolog 1 n=1 Tax=Galendromus occidentalis TaxID=34638 RepID=A0AAJ6QT66_9ACAR|nr:nanos homolog 1 [Galendromus occidentalis]